MERQKQKPLSSGNGIANSGTVKTAPVPDTQETGTPAPLSFVTGVMLANHKSANQRHVNEIEACWEDIGGDIQTGRRLDDTEADASWIIATKWIKAMREKSSVHMSDIKTILAHRHLRTMLYNQFPCARLSFCVFKFVQRMCRCFFSHQVTSLL